jgi:hypothetical protein
MSIYPALTHYMEDLAQWGIVSFLGTAFCIKGLIILEYGVCCGVVVGCSPVGNLSHVEEIYPSVGCPVDLYH